MISKNKTPQELAATVKADNNDLSCFLLEQYFFSTDHQIQRLYYRVCTSGTLKNDSEACKILHTQTKELE